MNDTGVFARRLGRLIKRERIAAGMTQLALAERTGVHQATIARWESGARTTTLEQVDRVLATLRLQLRLEVEQRADPLAPWHEELCRLAPLTPDQRLAETELGLVHLLSAVARYGGPPALVDGLLASCLQGIPGRPRRMALAIPPESVDAWVKLRPPMLYAAGADLGQLQVRMVDVPDHLRRHGGGILKTIYGYLDLRILAAIPPTVSMTLHDEFSKVSVTAEVITLAALPAELSRPEPWD